MKKFKINLLIIGKNSLLSKLFLKNTRIKNYTIKSRSEINDVQFKDYTHVLNFSFNPKLKINKYNKLLDLDYKLANKIKEYSTIYICISSRLVYSNFHKKFHEKIKKLRPVSQYGKNKLIIENKIKKIIPVRHLILRLSTLLYCNTIYKKDLFSYQMLSKLKKNNKIYFDFNENTYKDFITPKYFVRCLDKLIINNVCGTYNICSGVKIYVKDVAKKVIYGFKNGKIIFENIKKSQSFYMSNSKILYKTRELLSKKDIYKYSIFMGKSIL